MNDLPPDLTRLRTLETWLELQLKAVQKRIEAMEERERLRPEPVRAPRPEWLLETERLGGTKGAPLRVHEGGCAQSKGKEITREQAAQFLTEGIEACFVCRPDKALGIA
ncbi:DUF6233 domain-containing protein [Streptomyces sp. Ac-502]|uniref:DUF6233 domain-containing protein n=1 Tax=Streptomyces sp. Ac-502 TaxID=3342801 RepID=UPI003862AB07